MFDYIIVGQGLAGTVLGLTLLKKGKSVLFVNDESRESASAVSAGIFNPITGKRMVKTWKAEQLFPFLLSFYKEVESFLKISIVREIPIYKPFSSTFEQNEWMRKSHEQHYDSFIDTNPGEKPYTSSIINPAGGFETKQSGTIDVPAMIIAFRAYLIEKRIYINAPFPISPALENEMEMNTFKAKKIIFCEGAFAAQNALFSWLPFSPVKGEILEIEIENFTPEAILNKNGFLLPMKNKKFLVGSTYEKEYTDDKPSEKGAEKIKENLNSFFKLPYIKVGQKAGIRPATRDRRPIIGMHPEQATIGIFNGLGTKGVSLAPFFAQQFYAFLEEGKTLDPEVAIDRFSSFYPGIHN